MSGNSQRIFSRREAVAEQLKITVAVVYQTKEIEGKKDGFI